MQVHVRHQVAGLAVGVQAADGVEDLVLAGNAVLRQLRQQDFFHPLELAFLEEISAQQRTRIQLCSLADLVVFHFGVIANQAQLVQVHRGPLAGASLVQIVIARHQTVTDAKATQFLDQRFQLVVKGLFVHALGRDATGLDQVQPLGRTDTPARGGNDLLHHVGLFVEFGRAGGAAAYFDDFQHVHELALILAAGFLAIKCLIGEFHLCQHGRDHLRMRQIAEHGHAVSD